ncbi:hypothetical protein FQN55_000764 [Onygenales sp. PD_40]|nr:hypothetical protein FQN55_000764 [Onygenales sp. PD_40]
MDPPPPQSLRKRLRSYLSRASLQTITDKNTVRKDKEINKSKRGADFPAMPSDEIDHYDPGHKCDRRGIPKDSPFTTMGVYGETHGERVRYLQDLKDAQLLCPKHYPNLDAAIEHHKQFPANEEYPDMLVHFQNGKVVEKKDLDARWSFLHLLLSTYVLLTLSSSMRFTCHSGHAAGVATLETRQTILAQPGFLLLFAQGILG